MKALYYFGNAADNLYLSDFPRLASQGISLTEMPFFSIAESIGAQSFFFADEVHGVDGIRVTQETIATTPVFTQPVDFLVTNIPGIALGITTADCVPIIFYDTKHQAIAIAHAGWRGSVQGIALKVLEYLKTHFNTQHEDLQITFGPAARSCCYQVGPEFQEYITPYPYASHALSTRDGSFYFDGYLFNKALLANQGIGDDQMKGTDAACTICNHAFFSYRRQREKAGRQMTLVILQEMH
jgi:YfiH family protein